MPAVRWGRRVVTRLLSGGVEGQLLACCQVGREKRAHVGRKRSGRGECTSVLTNSRPLQGTLNPAVDYTSIDASHTFPHLPNSPGDAASHRAWQRICAASRKEFQALYDRMGVKLNERGESFYNPMLKGIVEELTEQVGGVVGVGGVEGVGGAVQGIAHLHLEDQPAHPPTP